MVSVSIFHTTEERDGMMKAGMEGGLSDSYVALDGLLTRMQGVTAGSYSVLIVNGPQTPML